MTNGHFDVFIDSDAFMALILEHDAQHQRCVQGFNIIQQKRLVASTSDLVISEASSVLSNRIDLEYAQQFLGLVQDFVYIDFSSEDRAKTISLFLEQTKKKTSFVDMANVVLVQRYHIPKIFSFDAIYPKQFDIAPFVSLN